MWVRSARFFTSPQDSPSGVSEGHNIPHWDPLNNDKALDKRKGVLVIFTWRARGPLTFRVFSNCEVILVIIPNVEMKDNRANTYFCRLAPKTWFQEKKIMYLSDSCTFHLESLEAPIACWYRSGEAIGYGVLSDDLEDIKFRSSVGLRQYCIGMSPQFEIEFLEHILKQQRQ